MEMPPNPPPLKPTTPSTIITPFSRQQTRSSRKRKRDPKDEAFLKRIKSISISTFVNRLSFSDPSQRCRGYHKALKLLKKAKAATEEKIKEAQALALQQTTQKWELLDSLDPDQLENEVSAQQYEIAKMFEATLNGSLEKDLATKHSRGIKRTFDVFKKLSAEEKADKTALPLVTNSTSGELFKEQVDIPFLLGEEEVKISKSCLVNLGGFFRDLLAKGFMESHQKDPIKIEEVDVNTFKKFKEWVEAPKPTHFDGMKITEIFEFVLSVHRFRVASLFEHCDTALSKKIEETQQFSELIELLEMLTAIGEARIYEDIGFVKTLKSLDEKLDQLGLHLSAQNKEENVFTSKRLKVAFFPRFMSELIKFCNLSLLQDATLDLNLTHLKRFKKYEETLIKELQQTESVHIFMEPGKSTKALFF